MKSFVSIQYARAFAAVIVVYTHVFSNRIAAYGKSDFEYGLWGVDIFFVISGFIMACSIDDRHPSGWSFALNRAKRILPLYWIALTLWVFSRFIVHDRLNGADMPASAVIQSYLLIPHFHAVFTHQIWPVLVPGWTLQIEIFFYAVITLTLFVAPSRWYALTIITMSALVVLGGFVRYKSAVTLTYTSPLLLEFAAGMVLAKLRSLLSQMTQYRWAGFFAVASLIAAIPAMYEPIAYRAFFLGVPAAVFVASLLVLEPLFERWPSRFALSLGDSSYSLYLLHPIAISAIAVLWERTHLPEGTLLAALLFTPVALAGAVVAALLSFRYLESPIIFYFRRPIGRPAVAVQDVERSAV